MILRDTKDVSPELQAFFERPRIGALVDRDDELGDGAQAMIALVLASPKFIFRAEQDETPTAKDAHPISEFALASRLSYFVWGSMPDDELFQLAYAKKLSANLEAQTQRLLKDPRSRYLTEGFGLQWLQLRRRRHDHDLGIEDRQARR